MPSWVRAVEIILGLVSLVAGLLVIAYPGLAFFTLVAILAVGLIFLGSRDIVLGAMGAFLPRWLRAADIVFGVFSFIVSVIIDIYTLAVHDALVILVILELCNPDLDP